MLQVIANGKLSPLAHNVASIGRGTVKNLMVFETIEGYGLLLENVLKLPSEVVMPKAIKELPPKFKEEWQWQLFETFSNSTYEERATRSDRFLKQVEGQWNLTLRESYGTMSATDDSFSYEIWEEEKSLGIFNTRKRREEEEVKNRSVQ